MRLCPGEEAVIDQIRKHRIGTLSCTDAVFCCAASKVLFCGGQEQLDPIELVDLAGAGVIIHGGDVCPGVGLLQRLDDPFAHRTGAA